jgi:hypothetical protein
MPEVIAAHVSVNVAVRLSNGAGVTSRVTASPIGAKEKAAFPEEKPPKKLAFF